jgi:hypothetical protein
MLRTLSLTFALAGCTAANNVAAPPDLATSPDLASLNHDLGTADSAGPPQSVPRADPWLSSGGGSASAGGKQLNLTVGGVAGRASAGNGAVITFGAFSTQTY